MPALKMYVNQSTPIKIIQFELDKLKDTEMVQEFRAMLGG